MASPAARWSPSRDLQQRRLDLCPDDLVLILRAMVRGAYDLQQLRMQSGLRLCANFRARLGPVDDEDPEADDEKKERAIVLIKAEYRRLTDGITSEKGRVNMKKLDFTGSAIISSAAEYVLVDSYIALRSRKPSSSAT